MTQISTTKDKTRQNGLSLAVRCLNLSTVLQESHEGLCTYMTIYGKTPKPTNKEQTQHHNLI